jgi:hypothetical protein
MGQTGIKLLKLAFFILTQSLARSLFTMYINPPIIKKCGVVLLSLCYTCHKHCVIFAAQAKTARARRSFERGCRHLQWKFPGPLFPARVLCNFGISI